ncbi:hypothetical protein Q4Q39_17455 [Flavivirga amylovorans]|uniref:Phage tail protein n=1 Tax=Flavivirga amylovorans TaxID=870486 RepID=A0ABT8X5G2_9FLAO|nr:hypothetical protein [Flavivirga amylovorans]MDO5989194.1 hypothetical protein [Flavivirga amylovorans]
MENYTVGNNTPIKVKTSISTEGTAFTFVSLDNPEEPNKYIPDIAYNLTFNSRRKQIAGGKNLKNRVIRIKTIVDFLINFNNEETFNLAVEQAKNSYKVEMFGGTPSEIEASYDVYPNFELNGIEFFTEISLS